jgi:hypothetical protein
MNIPHSLMAYSQSKGKESINLLIGAAQTHLNTILTQTLIHTYYTTFGHEKGL